MCIKKRLSPFIQVFFVLSAVSFADTDTMEPLVKHPAPAEDTVIETSPNVNADIPELDTITVIETKLNKSIINISDEVSTVTLSPEQIDKLPAVGEADITRTIQLLSGISGANESSSGLYIRGGTPDQNLILFDGFTIYCVDHFFGFFSPFNTNAVDNVKIYKGGYPAQYGSRISGVLDLNGKTGDFNTFSIGGGASFLSADAQVSIPLFGVGSFFFAARRSYSDVIESPIYNKIFSLFDKEDDISATLPMFNITGEPTFHFNDINSKLCFGIQEKDTLSASLYSSKDYLDRLTDGRDPIIQIEIVGTDTIYDTVEVGLSKINDDSEWGNFGTGVNWTRHWSKRYVSEATLSYSNYSSLWINELSFGSQSNGMNQFMIEEEDNSINELSGKIDNHIRITEENTLSFGCEVMRTSLKIKKDNLSILPSFVNPDDIDTTGFAMIDIDNVTEYGSVYLQDKWKLWDKFTLLPGLRVTYHTGLEEWLFDPRVSMSLHIIDGVSLKGAWGIYHQFINRVSHTSLFDLEGEYFFWLNADKESCPAVTANHYVLGASIKKWEFLLDIEAYYKQLEGLAEYSKHFSPHLSYIREGHGTAKGIEFTLQKMTGIYTGWLSYTLSKVEHTFPDDFNRGKTYPASHDRPHEIKWINSFSLKGLTLSGTWIYATGKTYTKPIGIYAIPLELGDTLKFTAWGEKNANRFPDYHRLDLSAIYAFFIGKRYKLSLGLSVFNVYNRNNIWKKEYRKIVEAGPTGLTDKNEVIAEMESRYMGITPSLFIRMNFN